jgi:Ni/Co efflux regulator RcnB
MKKLKILGLAIILATGSSAAQAGRDSHKMGMPGVGMPTVRAPGAVHRMGKHTGPGRNWGGRTAGRWNGGYRAPGGWAGYRRPFVGYMLPSYWISPNYYIGNYSSYGFSRPLAGYGWSRYYDDAVLTDRYGRVQDTVYNVDWDRYDAYDDGAGEDYSDSYGYRDDSYVYQDGAYEDRGRSRKRSGGVVGGLVGAGAGALAGGLIAGKGDNTEGAIIGGVVGAAAGAAIGSSNDRRYSDRGYRDYDRSDRYDRPRKYKKVKRSRRYRDYDDDYGRDYRRGDDRYDDRYDRGYEGGAHWNHGGGGVYQQRGPVVYRSAPPAYGYGYGGGETTTIIVQPSAPITTTTTVTTEEVVYAAAARKRVYHRPHKVWRPRPKPRCVCR